MMRVSVGLHHSTKGFYFLGFIESGEVEEWLLTIDLAMMTNNVFEWDGDLIPVNELNPTVIHLHSLDRAFNAHARFMGRCVDDGVKP